MAGEISNQAWSVRKLHRAVKLPRFSYRMP